MAKDGQMFSLPPIIIKELPPEMVAKFEQLEHQRNAPMHNFILGGPSQCPECKGLRISILYMKGNAKKGCSRCKAESDGQNSYVWPDGRPCSEDEYRRFRLRSSS